MKNWRVLKMTQAEKEKEKVKEFISALERVDKDIQSIELIKKDVNTLSYSPLVSPYNEIALRQIRDKLVDVKDELQEVFYNLVKRR
jgi:predicted RND superfamily exporter protein